MQLSAAQLAEIIRGVVEGDPTVLIHKPSKIEEGGKGTVTFLSNTLYEPYAYTTTASVIIVSNDFVPQHPVTATLIRVPDVRLAVAVLLDKFGGHSNINPKISEQAVISPEASIGEHVSIGHFCVVETNASIGRGCIIYPNVFIGEGVTIGERVTLYPGVRILKHCIIGNDCIIHANAVIGSDGFGFAPLEDGSFRKIAHTGNVVIEEQVEIGANCSIDRATIGSTRIKKGAKLDNLIHVAHNVTIGANTVMAAQVGIAGSTEIGNNCQIGGQVGFAGHRKVADGTMIQAQSGIASDIKEKGEKLFGTPAMPYTGYIKSFVIFKKLPELYKLILKLEKRMLESEKKQQL